jgi:NADH-quinone oxidoreductase subunit J
MSAMQFFFIVTAFVILFAAMMTVLARRMIHSALWFVLALLGVAVIFALLEASFFAVVQVLVYIGAISILIIFSVMLTREALDESEKPFNRKWMFSVVVVFIVLVGGFLAFRTWDALTAFPTELLTLHYDIGELGLALVDPERFALPFEVSSVLLLSALVGAVYVSFQRKDDAK